MDTATFNLNDLIQYGALGVIVMLFVLGKVVSSSTVADKDRRIATLEADNARMRQAMEEKVIPALVRATDVLARQPRGRT